MTFMLRVLALATLLLVLPRAASGQALSVLHIQVVLAGAAQQATPVPRHALLVSDNPASAPPRRIVTKPDGTADVRLRPGNYTVESERPVAFNGNTYQWTQIVEITAGGDAVLELTADNAEVEPVTSATTASAAPLEADPSFLLPKWQDSVVSIWTARDRASGFLIDAKGLIATNQRVIGNATSVEVQLTAAVKVAARVLAADSARDVAVLWIDPAVAGSVRPVPTGCGEAVKPSVASGQEIFTIGVPFRGPKDLTSGTVSRVEPHAFVSDLRLAHGSAGGPVFSAGGTVIGISSVVDENDQRGFADSRVVRIDDACEVLRAAEKMIQDAAPPTGTHLPVEPARPSSIDALQDAAKRRAGGLSPYQMSSSDFEVAFITPVLTYAHDHSDQAGGSARYGGTGTTETEQARVRLLSDFGNWSEYVADYPPVLLIRVTPKLVEGFWTTVARGAARTQGIALPPIKRFKPGFSRMRAFCGDAEVTPIHPFTIERRVSESDAMHEGLYVFDPAALGPQCGTVKLMLYSQKEPGKADTRVVDSKVLQQIWQDFALLPR